jgi:hypothetical protein
MEMLSKTQEPLNAIFKPSPQADNDSARAGQSMLPNPHEPPAFVAEQPFDPSVSGNIARKFLHPVLPVAFWGKRAYAAAMPEAAVNKDR